MKQSFGEQKKNSKIFVDNWKEKLRRQNASYETHFEAWSLWILRYQSWTGGAIVLRVENPKSNIFVSKFFEFLWVTWI